MALKRSKPIQRSKGSGTFGHGIRRCNVCKLGRVVDSPGEVEFEIGEEKYAVEVPRRMECDHCSKTFLHREDRVRAEAAAARLHRERVLDRDDRTCRRCGRSGIPLDVAHIVGKSRAQNPGKERDNLENLEACCTDCHRAEHGG